MPQGDRSSVVLDVRPGQWLDLGGISIEVLRKSGQVARIRVMAPREVRVRLQCDETSEVDTSTRIVAT